MTSKSVCRRLAIQLGDFIGVDDRGIARYTPRNVPSLDAATLREIADTLDDLTEKRRKEQG